MMSSQLFAGTVSLGVVTLSLLSGNGFVGDGTGDGGSSSAVNLATLVKNFFEQRKRAHTPLHTLNCESSSCSTDADCSASACVSARLKISSISISCFVENTVFRFLLKNSFTYVQFFVLFAVCSLLEQILGTEFQNSRQFVFAERIRRPRYFTRYQTSGRIRKQKFVLRRSRRP